MLTGQRGDRVSGAGQEGTWLCAKLAVYLPWSRKPQLSQQRPLSTSMLPAAAGYLSPSCSTGMCIAGRPQLGFVLGTLLGFNIHWSCLFWSLGCHVFCCKSALHAGSGGTLGVISELCPSRHQGAARDCVCPMGHIWVEQPKIMAKRHLSPGFVFLSQLHGTGA